MNKDEILKDLANNEELREIIFNIARNDTYLKEELYQQVFEIICSYPDSYFEQFIINGKLDEDALKASVIHHADNQNRWKSEDFSKIIRKPLYYEDIENALDIPVEDSDSLFEDRLEEMSDIISQMKCCPRTTLEAYHSTILQAYLRNNNKILPTARELNINEKYVRESIKYTKEKLKEELLKKGK